MDFIKMSTEADGIISTKVPLIRRGNELDFITVQRCFLLDSMAYENLRQQQHQVKPDYIEVLPGIMPQVISNRRRTDLREGIRYECSLSGSNGSFIYEA